MTEIKLNTAQLRKKELFDKNKLGILTNKQLSFELMLSVRRIQTIKAKRRKYGDSAFVHGNTGRKPVFALTQDEKEKIINIKETVKNGEKIFRKVNFTHFKDILSEYYNINYSQTTITNILKEANYKSPKSRRKKRLKAFILRVLDVKVLESSYKLTEQNLIGLIQEKKTQYKVLLMTQQVYPLDYI